MKMRQSIQRWHVGQLIIVWVVCLALIPLTGYAALVSSNAAGNIDDRQTLAIRDSVARSRLDSAAMTNKLAALLRQGYSAEIAFQVFKSETGIQDSSFHRPTRRDLQKATLLRGFVSYPLALLTLLLLPVVLILTWIWLSGRRPPDAMKDDAAVG